MIWKSSIPVRSSSCGARIVSASAVGACSAAAAARAVAMSASAARQRTTSASGPSIARRLGEIIKLWSGGGGGYGDPLRRDPAWVKQDIASGLVSEQRGRDIYGVVLLAGAVDEDATAKRRMDLVELPRPEIPSYDFGPGRSAWERIDGVAAGLIAEFVPSLPAGVQRYAQARAYQLLHQTGAGPYDAPLVKRILRPSQPSLARLASRPRNDQRSIKPSRRIIPAA